MVTKKRMLTKKELKTQRESWLLASENEKLKTEIAKLKDEIFDNKIRHNIRYTDLVLDTNKRYTDLVLDTNKDIDKLHCQIDKLHCQIEQIEVDLRCAVDDLKYIPNDARFCLTLATKLQSRVDAIFHDIANKDNK